jgi:flavin reductase (DIM6/NTAB) family NADH-FMN oxidoreductase RutF
MPVNERRPIQADIRAGGDDDAASVAADRFREAFSRWAASVTIVAVRDDGAVHATTVTSFAPVSARPPMIIICLGPTAQALPFAEIGAKLGVSVLSEDQRQWASIFADSFPVRAPDWSGGEAPLIPDAVAALTCSVRAVHPTEGGSRLVLCQVDDIELGDRDRPLVYWRRGYRGLGAD